MRVHTLLLLALFCVPLARAASYVNTFDNGPGPYFTPYFSPNNVEAPALWTLNTDGPTYRVSKGSDTLAGTQSYAGLSSELQMSGNFDVSLDYRLFNFPTAGDPRFNGVGMNVYPIGGGTAFLILRFALNSQLGEVYYGGTQGVVPWDDVAGTFRIIRTGSTITGYLKNPSGSFVTIATVSGFSGPAGIDLDAYQSSNSGPRSTTAIDVEFDNLNVTADAIQLPEPTGLSVIVLAALGVLRRRRR